MSGLRIGIAHHFGWAVVVTVSVEHEVVDRRRIELIEPGVAAAPVHHEGKDLADDAAAELIAEVRASARRATSAALDVLGDQAATVLDGPRSRLGPPWTKDHRIALAATVLAGA